MGPTIQEKMYLDFLCRTWWVLNGKVTKCSQQTRFAGPCWLDLTHGPPECALSSGPSFLWLPHSELLPTACERDQDSPPWASALLTITLWPYARPMPMSNYIQHLPFNTPLPKPGCHINSAFLMPSTLSLLKQGIFSLLAILPIEILPMLQTHFLQLSL